MYASPSDEAPSSGAFNTEHGFSNCDIFNAFISPDPGKWIGEMLSYNYHLSQQNIPLNITEMINKSIETVAQDITIYLEGQPKFSTALRKNERAVFEQLFVAGSRYSIYTDNRVSYSESANV